MEFSELFTQSARDVLPQARRKSLVGYFDVRGPRLQLVAPDAPLRACFHRILLGIVDCFESGFVMFSADVSPSVHGQTTFVVHAAGTGQPGDVEAVLRRLQLQDTADHAAPGRRARAEGRCPATNGRVQFVDAGLDGLVLSVEGTTHAVEVPDVPPQPYAAGAPAWLVSGIAGALESIEFRLRQYGWNVTVYTSLRQALDAAARSSPRLIIAAEETGGELGALEKFPQATPEVRTVLAVVAGSASLPKRLNSPVDIRVLPLSPLELELFTADVDPEVSTVEARQTYRAPLHVRESRRVLVVDDNPVNQLVARGQLEALGFDVVVAADGLEALDSCCDVPPDMVLMDVDMPVMNGLEASEHLREMQRVGTLPPFPIVAATSGDDEARREACSKAGMDGFLSKPMELQTLAEELHRVLPSRLMGFGEYA